MRPVRRSCPGGIAQFVQTTHQKRGENIMTGVINRLTLRLAATAIAAALAAGTTAAPASAETYAVIVKTVNDVFSAPVKEGCEKAAKDLGVECYYIGPSEVNEAQQLQVINDVLTKGDDG